MEVAKVEMMEIFCIIFVEIFKEEKINKNERKLLKLKKYS
jgi:hypothetical protein